MVKAVVADSDRFKTFLAAQPLCKWIAQTQREIAAGTHPHRRTPVHPLSPKNDNSELADALSSMA